MNSKTVQVLDEMVLSNEAKQLLFKLGVEGMTVMSAAQKLSRDNDKLLTDFAEAVQEELAPQLNLCRWAMASCDVGREQQEQIVSRASRRIASLALEMLARIARGEPADDEHAQQMENMKRLQGCSTQAERLRVLADMLESKEKPTQRKGMFS